MKKEQLDEARIKKIANRIKELRIEKGYSSHEFFAWEHKLSRVQYYKMEAGTNFTMKSLFKILNIHEISLEDFFKGLK